MPTVDFLPFATGGGANVVSQATFAALSAVSNGFSTGTAISNQLNKVWRQSSFMSAVIANFMANQTGLNILDDGNLSTAITNFTNAVKLSIAGTVPLFGGTSTGTADALAFTTSPTFGSYVAGQRVWGYANATNLTTTPTVNFNAIGAVNLKDEAGAALGIGDIVNGKLYEFSVFSATEVRLTADVNDPVTLSGAQTIVGAKTFSSALAMSGAAINTAQGADVASASTIDLDAMTGNESQLTGTATVTTVTLTNGRTRRLRVTGLSSITASSTLVVNRAASGKTYAFEVGDIVFFEAIQGVVYVWVFKMSQSGLFVMPSANIVTSSGVQSIAVPSWFSGCKRALLSIYKLTAATDYNFLFTVNADTGANYSNSQTIHDASASASNNQGTGKTAVSMVYAANLVESTSIAYSVDIDFEDPTATALKRFSYKTRSYTNAVGNYNATYGEASWVTTSAITTIELRLRATGGLDLAGGTIDATGGTYQLSALF